MRNTMKSAVSAGLVVAVSLAFAGAAVAHEQPGLITGDQYRTDLYQVSCTNDPSIGGGDSHHLAIHIRKNGADPGGVVTVNAIKGNFAATSSSSTATLSAFDTVVGGNGTYLMQVTKSAAGTAGYFVEYHCENASGGHTGTSILQVQQE